VQCYVRHGTHGSPLPQVAPPAECWILVSCVFHVHIGVQSQCYAGTVWHLMVSVHQLYLGITLDRTLSYKQHLPMSVRKLKKSRNSLLTKLAGSSWECQCPDATGIYPGLRYSVGKYCAPVWVRSTHVAWSTHIWTLCGWSLAHSDHSLGFHSWPILKHLPFEGMPQLTEWSTRSGLTTTG